MNNIIKKCEHCEIEEDTFLGYIHVFDNETDICAKCNMTKEECSKCIHDIRTYQKCKKCGLCARQCPVGAISGEIKKKFEIDQEKCIKCGKCYDTCRFGAITKE